MPIYEHHCRACELDWAEEYSIHDDPPEHCPECESEDVYRCVTDSGVVHFKGPGWSPDGYNKYRAYDSYKNQGIKVYDRKEDLQADMRHEAEQAELAKLKRENETAKRIMGPDAAVRQEDADKAIKKAGEDAAKGAV